jgi:hypothetical protein
MGSVQSLVARDARYFESSMADLDSDAVLVSDTDDIFFRYSNISSFKTLPPFPDPFTELSLIY